MQKRSEKNAPYFDIGSLPLGKNVPEDEVEEVPEEKFETCGQVEGLLDLRAEDGSQVLAQARAQLSRLFRIRIWP